jgi:hypothetical protein
LSEVKKKKEQEIVAGHWVVMDLNPDATGYGNSGKSADANLIRCNSEAEADKLAETINEYYMEIVMGAGGYPGSAWVLDLNDPDCYAGNADDWYADHDWFLEEEQN